MIATRYVARADRTLLQLWQRWIRADQGPAGPPGPDQSPYARGRPLESGRIAGFGPAASVIRSHSPL